MNFFLTWLLEENEEEPADSTEEEPVSNHCVSDTFTAPEEHPLRPL